ncbi:MAG: response regulator [Ruminococcus sp.]|nr:response regulator [Ruminococcus sp.]
MQICMKVLIDNEISANIAAAKVMRITIYIYAFIYLLDVLGIFVVPLKAMTVTFLICAALLITPTILIKFSMQEKKWLKYVIVLLSVAFISVSAAVLSYHVKTVYIYPIAIASLYFSGSLNLFATISTIICISIGQFVSFFLTYVTDENIHNFKKLCLFHILPNALTVFAVAMIFNMLSKRTAKILTNLSETYQKARENDALRQEKMIAENANKAKSDFLANMSHEIRTPINAIIGMNEMVLRESEKQTVLEYASNIQAASNTLLSTVNDILDFSKIESGKMEIIVSEYNLGKVLNDVITMIEVKAKQKNLTFSVHVDENIPEKLIGDEIRIKQVLINLLNNAVKYTPNGFIELEIKGSTDANSDTVNLEMAVKDSGIGIQKENLAAMFEGFQRFDIIKNRHIEGSGLGLAITHKIITMMQGRIDVDSVYGEGSVFTIYVSQKIAGNERIGNFESKYRKTYASKSKYSASFTAPEAEILVVDDNSMNITVITNLLKNTLVKLTTCMSGYEALEIMETKKFDIVLLDHMMPEMDGIQTLHCVMQIPDHLNADTPFIALTANAIAGVKNMYLSEGFTDYISKPVDAVALEEMLAKYIPKEKLITDGNQTSKAAEAAESPEKASAEKQPEDEINTDESLIDRETGIANCGNMEKLYNKILKMFCTMYEEKHSELNRNFEQQDWQNYIINIHSLKSNAYNIGCAKLGDLCLKLELSSKNVAADKNKEEEIAFIENNHSDAMKLFTAVKEYIESN